MLIRDMPVYVSTKLRDISVSNSKPRKIILYERPCENDLIVVKNDGDPYSCSNWYWLMYPERALPLF